MESVPRKEFEERFSAFGHRIAEIDISLNELKKAVYGKLDSIQSEYLSCAKKISECVDKTFDLICEFANHKQATDGKFSPLVPRVCELEKKFEGKVKADMNHCEMVGFISRDVVECKRKIGLIERDVQLAENSKSSIFYQIGEINDSLKIVKGNVADYRAELRTLDGNTVALHSRVSVNDQNIQHLEKSIECERYNSKVIVDDVRKHVDEVESRILSIISQEMSDVVIPDVSKFITSEALAPINQTLHLASIDAKNAHMRAQNLEMQTAINTKKIEGIQLAMKQAELATS